MITIDKEEIIKAIKDENNNSSVVSQQNNSSNFNYLSLLNNRAIQEILLRIVDRFLPPKQQPQPQPKQTKLDSKKIVTMIQAFLSNMPKETTVGELQQQFEKNKDTLERMIKNVIEKI